MQSQQRSTPQTGLPVRGPVPDNRERHNSRSTAVDAASSSVPGGSHSSQQSDTTPTQPLLAGQPPQAIADEARSPTKENTSDSSIDSVCSERRSTWICIQLLFTCSVFAVTAWFAQATFSNEESSRTRDVLKDVFKVDIGDTLTILAVLSGLLGLLTGMSIDTAFETMQWYLTCRAGGVSMSTILAVSPTTGALGSIKLLYRRGPSAGARLWSAGK